MLRNSGVPQLLWYGCCVGGRQGFCRLKEPPFNHHSFIPSVENMEGYRFRGLGFHQDMSNQHSASIQKPLVGAQHHLPLNRSRHSDPFLFVIMAPQNKEKKDIEICLRK